MSSGQLSVTPLMIPDHGRSPKASSSLYAQIHADDGLVLVTGRFLNVGVICDQVEVVRMLLKDSVMKVASWLIQLRSTPYFSPRERSWKA